MFGEALQTELKIGLGYFSLSGRRRGMRVRRQTNHGLFSVSLRIGRWTLTPTLSLKGRGSKAYGNNPLGTGTALPSPVTQTIVVSAIIRSSSPRLSS